MIVITTFWVPIVLVPLVRPVYESVAATIMRGSRYCHGLDEC
jgi:hypothetical protein